MTHDGLCIRFVGGPWHNRIESVLPLPALLVGDQDDPGDEEVLVHLYQLRQTVVQPLGRPIVFLEYHYVGLTPHEACVSGGSGCVTHLRVDTH